MFPRHIAVSRVRILPMKIALIGYGAMGKLISVLAEEKGHQIAAVINDGDGGLSRAELSTKLVGCDVAIDFTVAEAVRRNVEACVAAGVPLVEGTTGWHVQRSDIEGIVQAGGGAMVFGANFSIGVNIFFRIAEYASELIAKFPEYEAFIEEQHHSRKKDSPSGTALQLKKIVGQHLPDDFSIAATRAGDIPGTHRVGFDGVADQILLDHTARSREGFAFGALMAAEWTIGKKGFYEFSAVLNEIIERGNHR